MCRFRDTRPLIVREPLLVQTAWFAAGFVLGLLAFFILASIFL